MSTRFGISSKCMDYIKPTVLYMQNMTIMGKMHKENKHPLFICLLCNEISIFLLHWQKSAFVIWKWSQKRENGNKVIFARMHNANEQRGTLCRMQYVWSIFRNHKAYLNYLNLKNKMRPSPDFHSFWHLHFSFLIGWIPSWINEHESLREQF